MRRLAGQTQDPQIREELLARAEKLAPTPEPETKVQKTGTELQKTGTTGGQGELGMAQGETGAPAAAGPPAAAAEPAAPRQHTTGSSPFFQRIADELGGIHTSSRSDAGFDRLKAVLIGGKKPNGKARGPLFTNAGAKMDRFVEWLQGRGYLTDADVGHADEQMV